MGPPRSLVYRHQDAPGFVPARRRPNAFSQLAGSPAALDQSVADAVHQPRRLVEWRTAGAGQRLLCGFWLRNKENGNNSNSSSADLERCAAQCR